MLAVHKLVSCCYLHGYRALDKHYTVVIRNKIVHYTYSTFDRYGIWGQKTTRNFVQ